MNSHRILLEFNLDLLEYFINLLNHLNYIYFYKCQLQTIFWYTLVLMRIDNLKYKIIILSTTFPKYKKGFFASNTINLDLFFRT